MTAARLPALRLDDAGHRHVDLRAVLALAFPLFLNSSIQVVLNLTDTWFVGRLSTDAMAAMGACYYLVFVFFLVLGGVGLGVQTLVAQYYGAGRLRDAAHATWSGVWGSLLTTPLFLLAAWSGPFILARFELQPHVLSLAVDFWVPRMLGGSVSAVLFSLNSFFNGIGRPRYTFWIMLVVAVTNAVLNELFMFRLGYGIAGASIASSLSLGVGSLLALGIFLDRRFQTEFDTRHTVKPDRDGIRRVFALGIPTGLFPAMDVIGLALFQLMQVRLSPIDGAATQIVMMLTSISYLPAIGIALAGTTLVGQSIGAGDKAWAARCAQVILRMAVIYMGVLGVGLALTGSWVVPVFMSGAAADAPAVTALCLKLLWIAAGYQIFDALNLGSAFCLRGAGDVRFPTVLLLLLSWLLFMPLCHALTFPPGAGWVHFLPQWGLGAAGGWLAALVYTVALGLGLWLRWRSGAWRRIDLSH
ncbi:MAG: MATE family efflux transporter, partial [Betaproteobacteria bacterium]|nr:MATE family efflux transporter [Betaproteobacteria bacterium]